MANRHPLELICNPSISTEAQIQVFGRIPPSLLADIPWINLSYPKSLSHCDLALFIDPFTSEMDKVMQQLAAARDQWAKQVLVLLSSSEATAARGTTLFALGFSKRALSAQPSDDFCAYGYSIANYKATPDWLNSKYWANPEQWSKT